ncbi:hypothetical protein BH11CYA1_BH11CYA1_40120 [soil metagenome]
MARNFTDDDLFNDAWLAFNREVPSDQAAADFLYDSLVIHNKIECACKQPQIIHKPGERFYSCRNCKKVSWVTSGTLFAGVVKLRAWLALIWLNERGISISAARFSRVVSVAQSTALNIQKKLGMVIESKLDNSSPGLPSQLLSAVVTKRSKETPAHEHPRAELEACSTPGAQFQTPEQWQNYLTSEEEVREAIANYSRSRAANSAFSLTISSVVAVIQTAIAYIRTYFQGVSRKYLQLYLTLFWCHSDRLRWTPGTILLACLEHPPISYEAIIAYVSPSAVKIFPALG